MTKSMTQGWAPLCCGSNQGLEYRRGNRAPFNSVGGAFQSVPPAKGRLRSSPTSVTRPPFAGIGRRAPPQARAPLLQDPAGQCPGAPNKKYKTEMCRNMLERGYCRFGDSCHYAHSEAERHSPGVDELMKDDMLMLPCCILVSTGFCPYGHRCKNLHDPNAMATADENVVVLDHYTKFKKNADAIPDRLYHHQLNSIRQVNPLIAPYLWNNCRPSRSVDENLEWRDTYDLVCNSGRGAGDAHPRPNPAPAPLKRRTGSGPPRYSDVVNKNSSRVALGELQRLCIVLKMRAADDTHLDFIYSPTDSVNGQPCKVLQARHFCLLDFAALRQPVISIDDVVGEISPGAYCAGKLTSPEAYVSAHEVAFDSKGKRTCNLSVWFDAEVTSCSVSKAKRMSKMDEPWKIDDKSGALFCMPNNDEFESSFPAANPPYVFMQPVDDLERGHGLISDILEHRVETILLARGFRSRKLPHQLGRLGKAYASMKGDLGRWAWPRTSDTGHFSRPAEARNRAEYRPSAGGDAGPVPSIWASFVVNLNVRGERVPACRKRLDVFRSIVEKGDSPSKGASLPYIGRVRARAHDDDPTSSRSEATWRELILGEEGGAWKRAIESHRENAEKNGARSTPTPDIYSYCR